MLPIVGFIGLGVMGGPMASNLQKSGYSLVVHDINRSNASPHIAAGALWADSPAVVAQNADVVLTSLPGPDEVEQVVSSVRGVLSGLRRVKACIDLSTNSLAMVRRLDAELSEAGIGFLDAPISGGPLGAASKKLAFWVGGDRSLFEQYENALSAMGDQVAHIGAIGSGTIAKLVHNIAGLTMQAALIEAFSMGVKAGLDPQALYNAISQGLAGRRRSFEGLAPVLEKRYDQPHAAFALRLAYKDALLATGLGKEFGVPMRLSDLMLQDLEEGLARGWGDRASQVTALIQEERSGAKLSANVRLPETPVGFSP